MAAKRKHTEAVRFILSDRRKGPRPTPAKLDKLADEYFRRAEVYRAMQGSRTFGPKAFPWVEKSELAGRALRRWAAQLRRQQARAKKGRI